MIESVDHIHGRGDCQMSEDTKTSSKKAPQEILTFSSKRSGVRTVAGGGRQGRGESYKLSEEKVQVGGVRNYKKIAKNCLMCTKWDLELYTMSKKQGYKIVQYNIKIGKIRSFLRSKA